MPQPPSKPKSSRTTTARPAQPIIASGIPIGLRAFGAVCLVTAIAASLILALDHFALASPPGCGPSSGCDRATRSEWGMIPLVNWPTSLLGVAYFGALLTAWLASSLPIHRVLRITVWLGAIGSCVFVYVMLAHGYVCKYCLAAHAGNFLFVLVMEIASRRAAATPRAKASPLFAGALAFAFVTAGLAVMHVQTKARRFQRDEEARKASMQGMTASRPSATAPDSVVTTTTPAVPIVDVNAVPFTGRWRLGPENAPIRIVMFMDYQCEDCRQMESQAMALLQRRGDVSLSVKHFPMCADCNPNMGGSNMHPNACWAARAAEAAGMLRGNDGFWQMHNWLFQNKGSFTDSSLPVALQQMGYDPNQFIQMMSSNNTLRLVRADIDEGAELGLHFTPMIFINGGELRGFIGNPGALTRTVDELAATNPQSGSAKQDQPPRAAQKYIDDWARQPRTGFNARSQAWSLGKPDAKVQIVVWSDYQQPLTVQLDRLIKAQIAAGRDVRYTFRHYPFDQSCNSGVQQTIHPFGCMAARAAEAAGALGGNDAYWKMHDWLLAHQVPLNDQLLGEAATAAGLDSAALLAKMSDPEIASIIAGEAGRSVQYIHQGIPTVYVNNRWVPRWNLNNEPILQRIIEQAERGE